MSKIKRIGRKATIAEELATCKRIAEGLMSFREPETCPFCGKQVASNALHFATCPKVRDAEQRKGGGE